MIRTHACEAPSFWLAERRRRDSNLTSKRNAQRLLIEVYDPDRNIEFYISKMVIEEFSEAEWSPRLHEVLDRFRGEAS